MEVSEQSKAEGIPEARPSQEIHVDQDLDQQDKVRGLGGEDSPRGGRGIATASCSLWPRSTIFTPSKKPLLLLRIFN